MLYWWQVSYQLWNLCTILALGVIVRLVFHNPNHTKFYKILQRTIALALFTPRKAYLWCDATESWLACLEVLGLILGSHKGTAAIWVEFAHFVSYHLACYPNPYPYPNPNSNPNPNLGRRFYKMNELYLFSGTAWVFFRPLSVLPSLENCFPHSFHLCRLR